MNRAERRYRTLKIAKRRWNYWRNEGESVGVYRKWNLTCSCKWCKIGKYCDIRLQRWKDERRNMLEVA